MNAISLNLTSIPAISGEISDAASELACRIGLGEFDDLGEAEINELRGLSEAMSHWAAMAQAMEERLATITLDPFATLHHGLAIRN